MTQRPNFLYIMVDQMRADWMGCAGHKVVKTPNIDALAAQGMRFTQMHVASPVCMPNRASFMTGRFPSVHGLRYNGCKFPQDANTFVDVLRASGYATASIGKSHLQPFTPIPAERQGEGEQGPIEEAWADDPRDYGHEAPDKFDADARYEFPKPYYGFDHVDVVTGHGDVAKGHYHQWFREQHSDWKELIDRDNELPHDYTCPQAFRTPIPEESYPTAYIRDRACDYLKAQKADPFFAFVSFSDPHHPFNPPGKYWDMYNPDEFDVPVTYDDHKNPPPPLQDAYETLKNAGRTKTLQTAFMASGKHVREAMALSAGMLTMIDDAIGKIIAALKESGQFDNTVIIFNSDHGDYMGDFNMLLKGAWALDSINRVPMIWSDPDGRAAGTSDALTSTVDISATILERAGIKPYWGMQGQSFLSCLTSGEGPRQSVFIEYNDGLARSGFERPARVRSVVTQDWQLSVYKDQEWGELYDRRTDQRQTHNLWEDADHAVVRAEMFELLTAHLINQMDESPRSERLA